MSDTGEGNSRAADDEIRLSDLVRIFSARSPLMGVVVALSLSVALVFLWWASPVYRAELYLLPPLVQDVTLRDTRGVAISSMELERLPFEDYTTEDVYIELQVNLRSRNLRREFFDQEGVYERYARELDRAAWSPDKVFEELFNPDLEIHQPRPDEDAQFVHTSFELDDPGAAAELLNGFVASVEHYTVQQLIEPVQLRLRGQIQELKDEIVRSRKSALTLIGDEITEVDEAAKLAKTLGMIENVEPISRDPQGVGIAVNTTDSPAYRRGERALRAELAALEERKGSDAFVPGLRELEDQLARLSTIELDSQQMHAMRMDQAAIVPERPVFPRRALVLALALVVGIMLALGAALAQHAWQRIREEID